jgi:hypothetical protein
MTMAAKMRACLAASFGGVWKNNHHDMKSARVDARKVLTACVGRFF